MKKIFIFIMIFLCFGCTAKYELKINEDLSLEHTITGLETNDFYNLFVSSKLDVIKLTIAKYNDYLYYNNYDFKEVTDNDLSGGYVYKKFSNLDEFNDEFKLYKIYFSNLEIKNEKKIISIKLSDKIIDDGFSDRYIIDDGKIIIDVPFEVIESNADEVDRVNHKYIWNFDLTDKTKDNIYIKFDSTSLASNKFISIIVIIVSVIIVLIGSIFIYKRFKYLKKVNDEI